MAVPQGPHPYAVSAPGGYVPPFSSQPNPEGTGYGSFLNRSAFPAHSEIDPCADLMRGGENCVLMLYGESINKKLNCNMIFNLLCQYGNVLRVKFLTKGTTAMVEMGSPDQAKTVMTRLRDIRAFGMTLDIQYSRQPGIDLIREPHMLPDGTPSYKDYLDSYHHRFDTQQKCALSQRNKTISPTNALYCFHAPPDLTEEKVMEMLQKHNAKKPTKATILRANMKSSSSLLEFATIEEAAEAMMLTNHAPLYCKESKFPYVIRLAFTTPLQGDYRTGKDSQPPTNNNRSDAGRDPKARSYPVYGYRYKS